MTRLWILLIFAFISITPAAADELRPGYLEFTQTDATTWRLVWKAPMRAGITPATQPILPKGCRSLGTPRRELAPLAVVSTVEVRCERPVAGSQIGLSNMVASQTDILVRVAPLGRQVQALRLTAAEPSAEIKERPDRWQVARTYFVTGVEHILFGYDHLLFVVSLCLLLSGAWTIAKAATAFTIAHSITLVGTTLGVLGLPQQPVEAVIALSIIFLAVEIVKKTPDAPRLSERIPWMVAFVFGLLHGFGFAGALQEIGLPENDVPTALLTFNLGVEAGQLLIVAATLAAMAVIHRLRPQFEAMAIKAATYAIGITASVWFIERIVA